MRIFEGERLAFVGIGGGSDCVQAAILALLQDQPAAVISIRSSKITYHGPSGAIGEERQIRNHGGEIARGVFRITPETTGSGRFLEAVPSSDIPVYLVVDYGDGTLAGQIQAAMDDFGGVQSVVAVDTGGDALYRAAVEDQTLITPDQDLASLAGMSRLRGVKRYSMVVAIGIDSPEDAEEVLTAAESRTIRFEADQVERILETYRKWGMDGSHPHRFGKGSFVWQAALRGESGEVTLPLPEHLVNDPHNPWNPVVVITPDMAKGYLMELERHLAAVRLEPGEALSSHMPKDHQDRTPATLKLKGAGNTTAIENNR